MARQWCGRLGKQDNCVIGVYGAYVGKNDASALVAAELFLPRKWIGDKNRRKDVHIPPEAVYKTQPEIACEILKRLTHRLPFEWVLGDDEFGRTQELRDTARELNKSYIFDVPKNTVVRRFRKGGNTLLKKRWNVVDLVRRIPVIDWQYFHVRNGEKGPIEVRAAIVPVATERDGNIWTPESFIVVETLDGRDRWYYLSHSRHSEPLSELVRLTKLRHRIEESFEETKGEVGLDHFETRTWYGWHHHMTLCLIAHWFLLREKRRMGKAVPGLTISMIRRAIGPLIFPATPASCARILNYHLKRNESVRQAHYRSRGLIAPPRIVQC